jgi:hypothetical protein
MKLNFVFGLETEEGPVIGCQTSPKSKSAIMFKQNKKNSNKIEVAFLSFYEPLVERFIIRNMKKRGTTPKTEMV